MVIEIRKLVVWVKGQGWGLTEKGHEETFWDDEKILYLVLGGSYTVVTIVNRH